MKMPVMRMALLASVTLAQLFSIQAAYAQRYHAAPWSYDAADHSGVRDHRFTPDEQRIIDEITRNDASAGK
jgi:hypothetical protein